MFVTSMGGPSGKPPIAGLRSKIFAWHVACGSFFFLQAEQSINPLRPTILNHRYFLREYFTSETGNRELAGWTIHRSIVHNADFVIF